MAWGDSTRVFVTASAGPIPKQNLGGEMSGQGMEVPSAAKIAFDSGTPEITLTQARSKTAKPRFAVACDYVDLMEGGFWEHFKAVGNSGEFELKIHWEKIHPNFPEDKKGGFIESVTLWSVGSGTENHKGALSFSNSNSGVIRVEFPRRFLRKMRPNSLEEINAIFLSIKFSASALAHISGFKDYDYDSPWNIQVGIYDGLGREVAAEKSGIFKASADASTWRIMRHKKFGEVPSFLFRYRKYRSEFNNNLDDLPQ